jgi:ferritin-like metal-binding protein YciE
MRLFSNLILNTLDDLFVVQLQDLYDVEQRLTKALPKLAEAASNDRLKSAFQEHFGETRQHVARLEKIFDRLGLSPERENCEAMKSLIAQGEEAINADGESDVKDAALIAAAQRVEHYEIAGYGSVRNFARQLGYQEITQILHQTLEEEFGAAKTLMKIAESSVNVQPAGVLTRHLAIGAGLPPDARLTSNAT